MNLKNKLQQLANVLAQKGFIEEAHLVQAIQLGDLPEFKRIDKHIKIKEREEQKAEDWKRQQEEKEKKRQQEIEEEALKRQTSEAEDEEDWRNWMEDKKVGRNVLKGLYVFPPGEYKRKEYIRRSPRGTTEPFWGEDEKIKRIQEKVDEIAKTNNIHVPEGWVEGYVAIEFTDKQGNNLVVFLNEFPMRRNVETKQKSIGNATYIMPQVIDGKNWMQWLPGKPRGEVREIIKQRTDAGEPGWAYQNRNNTQVLELLDYIQRS